MRDQHSTLGSSGSEKGPIFSVVIPTIGAPSKLELLSSVLYIASDMELVNEIILVWQGSPASEFLWHLPKKVRVLLSKTRASSYARNRGAELAKSDHLLFLDDDTTPPPDYLETATRYLLDQKHDFIYSNIETSGAKHTQASQPIHETIRIDRKSAVANAWEPGLILRRETFLSIKFDECLGPGCIHGSSEGLDFAIRLLEGGFSGVRAADLVLQHPEVQFDASFPDKLAIYSFGNGYVAVKHRLIGQYLYNLGKAAAKIIVGVVKLDALTVRANVIRLLALLLGPLIAPQPPFSLNSEAVRELSLPGSASSDSWKADVV